MIAFYKVLVTLIGPHDNLSLDILIPMLQKKNKRFG